jgi:glycosyltransferase involved in cell wall biosynthesis
MSQDEDSPLRVQHIVGSHGFSGIERHALRLVAELRDLGCTAELACPPWATVLRTEAGVLGVPVHLVPSGAALAATGIVHVHDGRSAVVGSLLARTSRASFVRTQHFVRPASATREGWRRSSSMMLHRVLNRGLDGYIAVSHAAADAARERRETGTAPIAVIPPGITLPPSEGVTNAKAAREQAGRPVVVSVGRLEPERRFDVLLDAIRQVRATVPNCRFVIAGSGSSERELRSQAHQLGVEEAISWTGWLPDVNTVLAAGHAYVNTWPWEGFGMAAAEAMAFALPVIAPSSGASPELVEHGVTGYLVPPEDPVALAAAICELVQDRPRAAAMGDAGRELAVSTYSVRQTALSTLAFYRRLPKVSRVR